jgi:hypothetical protein
LKYYSVSISNNYNNTTLILSVVISIIVSVLVSINHKLFIIFLGIIVLGILIKSRKLYISVLLTIISMYLVLNQGITNVGVNITFLIPIGEIVLGIGLIRCITNNLKVFFNRFKFPILIVFTYAITLMIYSFVKYGAIAFRDGVGFIEALYIFVTYSEFNMLSNRGIDIENFIYRFIRIVLNTLFIYSLFYINSSILTNISPIYKGYQKDIYLLGNFNSIHTWLLVLIIYNTSIVLSKNKNKIISRMLVHIQSIISLLLILITTSRVVIILYFLFIVLFILLKRMDIAKYLIAYVTMLGVVAFIIIGLGIKLKLRRGCLDIQFLKEFILSSVGKGSSGMSDGFYQRIYWNMNLIMESVKNNQVLTGRGFGIPLINFVDSQGYLVREPHNSYMSIYGRVGIIALLTWSVCMIRMLINSLKNFINYDNKISLLIVVFMIIGLFTGIVEPFFELPYYTIVFYSLLGMLLYCEGDKIKKLRRVIKNEENNIYI